MKTFPSVYSYLSLLFLLLASNAVGAQEKFAKIRPHLDCIPEVLFQYLTLDPVKGIVSSLQNHDEDDVQNLLQDTVACLDFKANWLIKHKRSFKTSDSMDRTLDQRAVSYFVIALYQLENRYQVFPDVSCGEISSRHGDFRYCKTDQWRCGFGFGQNGAVCSVLK